MKQTNSVRKLLIIGIALITFCCLPILGQSTTPTPDAESEALKREKELLGLMKDIAQNQNELFKATIGTLDTSKLPAGTVSNTTTEIESKILAYKSADIGLEKIVSEINALGVRPTKVLIFDEKSLQALTAHKSISAQSSFLIAKIDSLKRVTAPSYDCNALTNSEKAPVAPLVVVDTALQVLALFKSNTSLTGTKVDLDEFALYSALTEKLRSKGIASVYVPLYYPDLANDDEAVPQIMVLYAELEKRSTDLGESLTKITKYKEQLEKFVKVETNPACKEKLLEQQNDLGNKESEIKRLQPYLTQIQGAMLKVDEKTGLSLLMQLVSAEKIKNAATGAHLLQLKSISAGGTAKIKTTVLGSRLSFGGGSLLAYMLADPKGSLVKSGLFPTYGGFVRAKDITRELKDH